MKASSINGILMRAMKIELMHHETLLNMKPWINANQTIKALKPRSEASKTQGPQMKWTKTRVSNTLMQTTWPKGTQCQEL